MEFLLAEFLLGCAAKDGFSRLQVVEVNSEQTNIIFESFQFGSDAFNAGQDGTSPHFGGCVKRVRFDGRQFGRTFGAGNLFQDTSTGLGIQFINMYGTHAARPFVDTSANARMDFIVRSQFVLLSFLCWRKPLRTRRRTSQVEIDNKSAAHAVVTSNGSGKGTAIAICVFRGFGMDRPFVAQVHPLELTAVRRGVSFVEGCHNPQPLCPAGSGVLPVTAVSQRMNQSPIASMISKTQQD
jgi:hypothetical protein